MVEKRIEFKNLRKQIEQAISQTASTKEAVQFIHTIRSLKVKQIKDMLSGYSKASSLPHLSDISSKSFNQFSKVYQIQIFTERINQLITARNISNL